MSFLNPLKALSVPNRTDPRKTNKYAQIARWRPEGGHRTADCFVWDLSVMAGNLAVHTEGPDANAGDCAGLGHNQMLAGNPVCGKIRRFVIGPNGSDVTGLT